MLLCNFDTRTASYVAGVYIFRNISEMSFVIKMLYCVSVGDPLSVAVDEVNGFVYFGHGNGNITQVTLDGSSTKDISTGKLNLYDCSRVVMGYNIILHTMLLLIHDPCRLLIAKLIYIKYQCSL